MSSRSRPLLDFGAGLLIGLSITVALFAAMEESGGGLSHDMLVAAFAALALSAVLKFAAKDRPRRRRGGSRPESRRDETTVGTGWTVEAAPAAGKPAAAASSNDDRSARDARASAALTDLPAAHRNAEASAADGDTRRL